MTYNKKKFNSIFIREFRPGGIFESDEVKNVYHYASMETFLSIIKNQSIRFSDVRFMNDKSESIFFVKRLLEFQDEYTNTYPLFSEVINELLKGNDYDAIKKLSVTNIKYCDFPNIRRPEQRNFIFCTSINPDSLNMWNYYASGGTYTGCSIGLSVDSLLKTFDTPVPNTSDPFSVYYGKVLYAKNDNLKQLRNWPKEQKKFSEKIILLSLYPSRQFLFVAIFSSKVNFIRMIVSNRRMNTDFSFPSVNAELPTVKRTQKSFSAVIIRFYTRTFAQKEGLLFHI